MLVVWVHSPLNSFVSKPKDQSLRVKGNQIGDKSRRIDSAMVIKENNKKKLMRKRRGESPAPCGSSSTVEHRPSKPSLRVRFPSVAPESRSTKKKQIKKKKKKHKLDVKVMDIAVKIRCYLLREKESWSGVGWLKGTNLIEKEPIKIKERIFRAYRKIFCRDCVLDIAAAATEGDDFF